MNTQLALVLLSLFIGYSFSAIAVEKASRAFSLFNVVKFKNSACQAASDAELQGVCFTSEECSDNAGSADGNCAASFGVCCVLKVTTCAGTVTQNCSFIENAEYPAGKATAEDCAYTITRCSSEICQIRIDMVNFKLSQPAEATGLCTDKLVIVAGAGTGTRITPPTICGTNTGEHMYIDSGTAATAATLTFTTATANTGTWRVKVSQIACSSENKAPAGCLQYYTGVTGTIKSFNWVDGSGACASTGGCMIQTQDYVACARKENGMCSIQYSPTQLTIAANKAFEIGSTIATSIVDTNNCATIGSGFVEIPNVRLSTASDAVDKAGGVFCGNTLAIPNTILAISQSSGVVSDASRFWIRVVADQGEAQNSMAGFSLDYAQIPCDN